MDVVAFGHNLNDMEMLTFAGTRLSYENARDEIKAVADEVIGHIKMVQSFDYMEGFRPRCLRQIAALTRWDLHKG